MAACRRSYRLFSAYVSEFRVKYHRFCSTASVSEKHTSAEDTESSNSPKLSDLQRSFRHVMRRVPSTVVVVTTANSRILRGMTCGSFTSVSFQPPIISFCIQHPSHMHQLLLETQYFSVNILSKDQAHYATRFSQPAEESNDQFKSVPHEIGIQGAPILENAAGVLECKAHDVHTVGDHHVWYGEVLKATELRDEPLLYFARSYRSVGDEVFMQAFEDTTLLFEDWTHAAHLRMAWNYIREHGRDAAVPLIKMGIKKYNEQNKEKIERGYHETVTMFYIYAVADAIRQSDHPDLTFEEFIEKNKYLTDRDLLFRYYSPHLINTHKAKTEFETPDRLSLPQ
ncbi:uncharacterized protein LOC144435888 [Glandiceps talaboti]